MRKGSHCVRLKEQNLERLQELEYFGGLSKEREMEAELSEFRKSKKLLEL